MITILHGNNTTSSRNAFFDLKANSKNTTLIDGNGLTYDILFQAIENKSMFSDTYTIFVENFFAKNKSTSDEFKKISNYLSQKNSPGSVDDIVFWEADEVSKSALAQFKTADAKLFSIPQVLFQFLESIKPKNSNNLILLFHNLQKTMETELIFFMMIRQFRILLGISDQKADNIDEVKRLAPWQISKFKNQLSQFELSELKRTYQKLFDLDFEQKTGKSSVELVKAIDFFLLDL